MLVVAVALVALVTLLVGVSFRLRPRGRHEDDDVPKTAPAPASASASDCCQQQSTCHALDHVLNQSLKPLAEYKIALVGSGPGGVGMLTLLALQYIRDAEVIVADRLVPKEILDFARADCNVVITSKRYGTAHVGQEEIYASCLRGVTQGKRVVRLKNGDPMVFGRGGEEIRHFARHGVACVVVPGVSSSLAAAGIPLTMRGIADSFVVATGHGKDDTGKPSCPWPFPCDVAVKAWCSCCAGSND